MTIPHVSAEEMMPVRTSRSVQRVRLLLALFLFSVAAGLPLRSPDHVRAQNRGSTDRDRMMQLKQAKAILEQKDPDYARALDELQKCLEGDALSKGYADEDFLFLPDP